MEKQWYYWNDPYIGEITLWAGTYAPIGWEFCHGQLLPIAQYEALFTLIGTTYGGDGVNNFALPDLRGRVPIGFNAGPGLSQHALGDRGGSESYAPQSFSIPAQEPPFGGNTVVLGDEASTFNLLPPFLALNFMMAVEGIYPVQA
jgi:microcystin-dependent protein